LEIGQFNTFRTNGIFNLLNKNNQSAYFAGEFLMTDNYFDALKTSTASTFLENIPQDSAIKTDCLSLFRTLTANGMQADRYRKEL
jgi:hypothetical protein